MKLMSFLLVTLMLAGFMLLSADCGGGDDFGLREATVSGPEDTTLPEPQPVEAIEVFTDMDFQAPVFLTAVPGDEGLLAVVEQAGVIKVFDQREDSKAGVLLDISSKVLSGGEQGLIGLAFDPQFADNHHFYVNYTAIPSGMTVIARFTADLGGRLPQADPASEEVIIEQDQPYANHNGGMLAFGPDGYLYIALGDGGWTSGNAQDLSTILGKILRIDVSADEPYAIPADNPFIGLAGARAEIWAYGFRNPYRFSFDRQTGALWAGDVGQDSREEVDLVVRGGNYGWNLFEGSEPYRNPEGRPAAEFLGPVVDYGRTQGVSVIGGYVYRGGGIAGMSGAYLFGDYGSGKVWALVYNQATGEVVSNTELTEVSTISSFGEDASGEIYVVTLGGAIFRLQAQ